MGIVRERRKVAKSKTGIISHLSFEIFQLSFELVLLVG